MSAPVHHLNGIGPVEAENELTVISRMNGSGPVMMNAIV